VRICGQIHKGNKGVITNLVRELVRDNEIRKNVNYYHPDKNESKIIPWLIRLRLVRLIMWVCRYKAWKRYSKGSVAA
jgi:hypothetical protein